ncbi:MAG: FAD-dependent oxidoreductase [Actinomycetota bacterium]|nr:FAD-dependent oxidoreductase [Actinomycetota bacterium]
MKALVMGGGMAGLATAINLLDLGLEVELVEADEIFGGRASSWTDEDGDMIDNALHVFFPYYSNLLNFFRKMGIEENILWKQTEFYYMQEGGREAVLKFSALPAPFHALSAFATLLKNYTNLPKWKLLFTAVGMGGAIMYSDRKLEKLDSFTFGQWLVRRAPADAFLPLEPGINGLTFTPSWMISAKVMLNWFRKVAADPESARVGFANGGLGEIWVDTCLDYIHGKGGKTELGKAVTAINLDGGKVRSVTIDGEERTADLYVSSISPYALRKVLPPEAFGYEYFRDLHFFRYAPSLSLQVWFDRKLTEVDATFFSNNCIFNTYADLSNVQPDIFKGGSMFEMVLSPADNIEGLPDEVIFDIAIKQIRSLFPAAREAEVSKWKVVRERQGVYRALPGMEKHRPYQRTPLDNFYLSGGYTKTHVSSGGMEAAIWTSNHCAELIALDKLGKSASLNVEWKPNSGFVSLIKPASYAGAALAGLALARGAWKLLKASRDK